MKQILLLFGLLLCYKSNAQSYEVKQIGKQEPDVLFSMRKDSSLNYDSRNEEDDGNYHLTYKQTGNTYKACNFYFQNNVCIGIAFYYPQTLLPQIITNLNVAYKRTNEKTWIDNSYTYVIKIIDDDENLVEITYQKM